MRAPVPFIFCFSSSFAHFGSSIPLHRSCAPSVDLASTGASRDLLNSDPLFPLSVRVRPFEKTTQYYSPVNNPIGRPLSAAPPSSLPSFLPSDIEPCLTLTGLPAFQPTNQPREGGGHEAFPLHFNAAGGCGQVRARGLTGGGGRADETVQREPQSEGLRREKSRNLAEHIPAAPCLGGGTSRRGNPRNRCNVALLLFSSSAFSLHLSTLSSHFHWRLPPSFPS